MTTKLFEFEEDKLKSKDLGIVPAEVLLIVVGYHMTSLVKCVWRNVTRSDIILPHYLVPTLSTDAFRMKNPTKNK